MPPDEAPIFERVALTPGQLRTVADRRYVDAEYLRQSGLNRHANGVLYLGGFVIECLLKAELLAKHPWLASQASASEGSHRSRLRSLCYRWHDLASLLRELPELRLRLNKLDPTGRLYASLTRLCEEWTVFARYSPQTATMERADRFMDTIREIKKWVK